MAEAGYLVLDFQFFALEEMDLLGIGERSVAFFVDRLFKLRMLGFQGLKLLL